MRWDNDTVSAGQTLPQHRQGAGVSAATGIGLVGLFLSAIVIANLLVVYFGPSVVILNSFVFIGLDLTCRDALHDHWRHRGLWWKMALLIATGSILSWLLNRDAGSIAVASFVAFAAASSADAIVYDLLGKRRWFVRANGSNVAGALVDSVVFPTLAFGLFLPWIILGQFAAKVLGGLVWSLLLRRTRRSYDLRA